MLGPGRERRLNAPSSALNVSLMIFHSGLSAGSSCCMVSTIRYIMLSSTLRSVLSASEMAGFLTALLQAALLLSNKKVKWFDFQSIVLKSQRRNILCSNSKKFV